MGPVRRRLGWAVLSCVLIVPLAASPSAGADPSAQSVVAGLGYPSMFTIAPDGRIFYSEWQTGRIGVFNPVDNSIGTHFQVPDLCVAGDQGLFGLALHPGFPTVPSIYAYATRRTADGSCSNQVLRIDPGAPLTVLLSDPYVGVHIGGRLLFGPDGNLFVSTGDGSSGLPTFDQSRAQRAAAQDLNSLKARSCG